MSKKRFAAECLQFRVDYYQIPEMFYRDTKHFLYLLKKYKGELLYRIYKTDADTQMLKIKNIPVCIKPQKTEYEEFEFYNGKYKGYYIKTDYKPKYFNATSGFIFIVGEKDEKYVISIEDDKLKMKLFPNCPNFYHLVWLKGCCDERFNFTFVDEKEIISAIKSFLKNFAENDKGENLNKRIKMKWAKQEIEVRLQNNESITEEYKEKIIIKYLEAPLPEYNENLYYSKLLLNLVTEYFCNLETEQKNV